MEYFPKNDVTVKLAELLNKEWTGKTFVYKSKHGGEVFGEVKSISVQMLFTFDAATNAEFKEITTLKKFRPKGEAAPKKKDIPKSDNPYSAYRPKIRVKSTNNITYDIDEIFIVSKQKKKK